MLRPRGLVALLLLGMLLWLTPAAYADPPDPTWLGGYWDDDDFDTVVAFIASTFAVITQCDVDAEPCLVWIDCAEPAGCHFLQRQSPVPATRAPRPSLRCRSPDLRLKTGWPA